MTEPRWLEAHELAAWRYLSSVLHILPGYLDDALDDFGLSFFDYSILVWLSSAEDRACRLSDLAFGTQGSLSRLSHAAKRLEKRGLVRRTRCADDGRVTLAQLTDDGMALLEAAAPHHVESVRRATFDVLEPEQVGQLHAIGKAIVEATGPPGPPPWERR